MDHDFFFLFARYWWLIFPLFWMSAMVASLWSRHARANRALDLIKSYADQGKDIPPGVLAALQGRDNGRNADIWGDHYYRRRWGYRRGTFFFVALACAFAFLAVLPRISDAPHPRNNFGFIVVAVIMAAMAVASLLSDLTRPRIDPPPDGKDGRL